MLYVSVYKEQYLELLFVNNNILFEHGRSHGRKDIRDRFPQGFFLDS